MQLLETYMPLCTAMLAAISEASIPEIAPKCYGLIHQVVHEVRENSVHPVEKMCTISLLLWVVGYQVEVLLEQRVRERYNRLKKEGAADVATA
jgi:hypothetical protein